MEYKISELVSLTDVPKSTILYYIRQGMLPEAKKLKSNVHRYNDEHVELIKYIKYMQTEVGSSNEEIKEALKNKNQSFSSSSSMLEPLMHTLSSIPTNAILYTKGAFIEHFGFDATLIDELLYEGILLPTKENNFTDKEASIVNLIRSYKALGINPEIITSYVKHATALSELEYQMQNQLCDIREDKNFSVLWKILFETLFNAKSYIFSRSTYKVMLKSLKDELKKK